MNIREATLMDKDFILKGYNEVELASREVHSKLVDNFEKDLLGKDKKAFCYVLEDEGKIAGYFIYSTAYYASDGQGAYVSNIYLDAEYRRKGLFKVILDFISNNYEFVTFRVSPENKVMTHVMEKYGCEAFDLVPYVYFRNKRL